MTSGRVESNWLVEVLIHAGAEIKFDLMLFDADHVTIGEATIRQCMSSEVLEAFVDVSNSPSSSLIMMVQRCTASFRSPLSQTTENSF